MNAAMIFRSTAICVVAVCLSAQVSPSKYAVGQVWEYKTRPQDAGSLLKIQRISDLNSQKVYHLSIIRVHFNRPDIAGVLPHIPVSQATLDASVTKQTSSNDAFPTSAVDEGIAEWEHAKGGVFTISVSQIIDIVDSQVSQQ